MPGGLGASLGCPPDASEVSVLGMFPRVDPAHTGEIISFSWLGNTLMSLWQNWRWWLGLLGLLPLQPGPKYVAKKINKWMDGWPNAFGHIVKFNSSHSLLFLVSLLVLLKSYFF